MTSSRTAAPVRRPVARAGAALAVLGTALTSLVLVAPAAQAASWEGFARVHRGEMQACTRPVDASSVEVRARLDNRSANHTHVGGVTAADGRSRSFRVAAGQVSPVKSIVVRRSTNVSIGIGETTGEGLGGSVPARSIGRC